METRPSASPHRHHRLVCFLRHGIASENSLTHEASRDEQQPTYNTAFPVPAETARRTVVSVPGGTLGSIRQYREAFEANLRVVTHEDVGCFNPWAITDR